METNNSRRMPGRPKLSIGRGRAATIRKWLGKSDKQIGDEAKQLGISRIQQYESLNTVYKQLKKGSIVNRRNGELLIKNIPTEEAPVRRPQISEKETSRFKNVSNEFKFHQDTTGNQSFSIIGHAIPKLYEGLKQHRNIKFFFQFVVNFYHLKDPNAKLKEIPFTIRTTIINHASEIKDAIADVKTELRNRIEAVEAKESDLIYDSIKQMNVAVNKHKPMNGGQYVELDSYINNKKCCINIKNEDEKCFMYCILYHLNKEAIGAHPERVTKYKPYLEQYDWSKFKFPMKVSQIGSVEEMIGYGINVYGYDDKKVFPLRITKIDTQSENIGVYPTKTSNPYYDKIINLLLIETHYVYIKNIDVLSSKNRRNENNVHVSRDKHTCQNCLHQFSSRALLLKHRISGCDLFEPTRTELPKMVKLDDGTFVNPCIEFMNFNKRFKAPVVIYADFEALIQKTVSPTKTTTKLADLPPCSYAFNVVSDYPELNMGFQMYRGENTVSTFLKNLCKVGDKVRNILDTKKEMIITPKQEIEFNECCECHICQKPIGDKVKVRDHDHITGKYRGCAHQDCNVKFNYKYFKIPVFFHNLKGFDGHLIIQRLKEEMNFSKIDVIAQNFEKYMSFSFGNFRFLDSFAFMSSSLDTLTTNLLKDGRDNFKHTLEGDLTETQKSLILRKGVYPYEYIDSYEKFEETELPTIDKFYSSLNEEDISQKEYDHAKNVWKEFSIENLGQYHDLYLKTDVLLLSDIFEAFRKTAMSNYDLDPANYFTLPNFAWDAMLKMTKARLEQLTDVDKYLLCEQGIRGGTSLISHRYAKANNKYMAKYDETEEQSYIMYLDANNLYGHAMIQKLPTGGFHWVDYVDEEFIKKYDDNDFGYFVKCDLHYPQKLHDLHNNYPLAVESKSISHEELSPYQIKQMKDHNEKHDDKIKKLVPNLYDKKDYVCHIRNLKYYMEKGLVLTKIHTALKFNQSTWLKPYIDFNTHKRTISKNEFEKDMYKLMNNAVFGKTMENMRARVDIKLVTNESKYLKQVAKPQYVEQKIYSENLVAIKKVKKVVKLNKPIYVGVSVLDLSKLHMYQFHYDYIKQKYGEKSTLLFTDTDSLCYHIKTDDIYKDMKEDIHVFDQCDYSMDGFRSQDNSNKKVIGKFKDETNGVPIVEFCGLRSKMYSILLDGDVEKMRGKGIKKSALKKYVRHADYRRCLLGGFDDQRQLISFNNLRSVNHNIGMYRFTKVGLSCSNDKQYLLEEDRGISSLSYGHYKIPKLPPPQASV